jgi:hypothetical protein
LKTRFALVVFAVLAGCANEETQVKKASSAIATRSPWTQNAAAISPYADLISDQPRVPFATDFDVAWDGIAHGGDIRWECRGVPSGKFIANSLCADKPMVDLRWPDKNAPSNYGGVIVTD